MILVKLSTLGHLKIKVFWKKDYDVTIYVYDVTNKILPRDSNNIVDVVWHFYEYEWSYQFCKDLNRKIYFLRRALG